MTPVDLMAHTAEEQTTNALFKHVLIAEDDPMFRRILESWLKKWGYRVSITDDGTKAWNLVRQKNGPEMLLLDWVMPGIDGLELCRRIRECRTCSYQYILLLTGKGEKRDVITGLEAGADDYLIKPFDQDELRARLQVGQRILDLQRELIATREELRLQATHDALTGIWNRRAVLNLLDQEIERSTRSLKIIGVLMLDIDHFKKVNDTHGHQIGDEVLREVANRIRQNLRAYDLVGRYGGEEFLVVTTDCQKHEIAETADRIRRAICSIPILASSLTISVSSSIGVSVIEAGGSSQESLIAADQALYMAKNGGRNRVWML
jgi:two-component system, cell cycle response regulator